MPISSYTHNLESKEPVYVVRTPLPLTRKMLGVQFLEGEGRTKSREKARRFDEEFGYEVLLPKGQKPWPHATPHTIQHGDQDVEVPLDYDYGEDEDEE